MYKQYHFDAKIICFLFLALVITYSNVQSQYLDKQPFSPPVKMVHDTLFGQVLSDPYRYMENLDDPAVVEWFKGQSAYTRNLLSGIEGRQGLIDRMRDLDARNETRIYGVQIMENDRYFYYRQTPDDEIAKLFYRDGFEGEEQLLFDPEKYRDDTLSYSISSFYPSHDGSKVAFEIAPNGSESAILHIISAETQQLHLEAIDRCWFAEVSWLPDNQRFIYNRLNSSDVHNMERTLNSKAFLHTLGQSVDADREILSKENNPELGIQSEEYPIVFYDKYNQKLFGLLYTVDRRVKAFIASAQELDNSRIQWKPLFGLEDEVYDFETSKDQIFIYTPKGSPGFSIITTSIHDPNLEEAEVIVPEHEGAKIESFVITLDGLFYTVSINGVKQELYRISNGENRPRKIELPMDAGRLNLYAKSVHSSDLWVTVSGWTTDNRRFRYDSKNEEWIPEDLSFRAAYPELADLVVEELSIPSHDRVEIPLSLIYDKGLEKDGSNPVIMFGYGSYGFSFGPFFSPIFLSPALKGAIVAIAHVRGGGELGDDWYKAGYKTTKPNTWRDLIACAEYLNKEQYSAPKTMAIIGGSAGGILIGRAMTERPDLFAAAIPEVGCLNTVRMEFSPNGPANIPEFGTIKDSVEFRALFEMDSYHHITSGERYPATLITAGMNDPRVIAWQPAKFAAKLQVANASDQPILFLVDFEAGHGIGDSKTTFFESQADVFSFALWQTGHPDFQLAANMYDIEDRPRSQKNH